MPLLLPTEYSPEALRADVALQRTARSQLQMQLIALQEGINLTTVPLLKNQVARQYTVGQFETLPQVSTRFYGTPDYWPQLAEANNLEYPYIIVPGQNLSIPELSNG
ncbi:MAG: LysM peptidoglycan-binding domain-containing protein [Cyanobacteria bacterium]|nr:LysM peptidoglycan-binding domain-containing protein [Cyanobacteriota bacterium]